MILDTIISSRDRANDKLVFKAVDTDIDANKNNIFIDHTNKQVLITTNTDIE